MGVEHCSTATREACWHFSGVGKMPHKMVASKGTGRWWYLQHFASSNFLLWGLSICYQVLAQILLSRCLARRFLMLSSTTSHQSKQKRRLLHLPKPQTKMKNMWEKCQLPWNSICKGGSSLYIEKAVCTTLLLARNHPRAIAGKVLYQAGALDLDLLTKAVMMFLSCIGQIVFVCFFFQKITFSQLTEWFEAPQQVLKAHLVLKRSLPWNRTVEGENYAERGSMERNLRDILELYSKHILQVTPTILLHLW